jgi:hypothetical protein
MSSSVKATRVRCLVMIFVLMMGCLALCSVVSAQSDTAAAATIRRIGVLSHSGNFELEILASRPLKPTTRVVTGPDRLVIDFPNAVPAPELHAIAIKGAHVRGVRAGLFASNPPVARIVVDLDSPPDYEVFPSGPSTIIKINNVKLSGAKISGEAHLANVSSGASSRTSIVLSDRTPSSASSFVAPSPALPAPAPPKPLPALQVQFVSGKLWVSTDHATLGDVLRTIGQQIGATVSVPPQADRERVIAHLGPASAREVISSLLNGVPYNIILMGSGNDLSQVTSIVLTPRGPVAAGMPANYAPAPVQEAPPEPEPVPPPVEATPQQQPPPDTLPTQPQ